MEKEFTEIFKTKRWARSQTESVSGTGSTLKYTTKLREQLPDLFKKYKITSILDAPCGDFNWMQKVVTKDLNYIGGDIVLDLVNQNNEKYKSDNISFMHLDITKDSLPDADLMICRDCLFHLNYESIDNFFNNFKNSNIKYLLTTTHINDGFLNTNIITGGFRKIDLHLPPFDIQSNKVLEVLEDYVEGYVPRNMILLDRNLLNS